MTDSVEATKERIVCDTELESPRTAAGALVCTWTDTSWV